MFRASNPTIKRLSNMEYDGGEVASYKGISMKSVYFVVLTILAAAISFVYANSTNFGAISIIAVAASFIALICGFIAAFKPSTTPVTGTIYAVCQGLAVGFISCIFDMAYRGVVFAALLSTIGVFVVVSLLYSAKILRVGSFFRKFMMVALIGIIVSQLLIFVLSLFSSSLSNLFYGNGNFSILISIIMVLVASAMILIDLDNITRIVEGGMSKKYEWLAAFSLLVTLIWLYLEFLKLFAKLASRKND